MDLYIDKKLGVSVSVTTERRNKEFSLEIGDPALDFHWIATHFELLLLT